ncbi:MAG: hypothetical protein MUD08_04550 [Cytophagales bacterium]|jgi:hypothetical protein|nr:hypothetical protein [Cytophagales bacterium]
MRQRRPLHETIFASFGILMAVVYVVLGLVVIFTPLADNLMPKAAKILFGAAMALYGLFRLYRSVKQLAK